MKERSFVRFLVYVCLFSWSPPPTFVARGDDGVGNGGVGLDVQVGQGAEDLDPLAKGAAAGQGGDHLGQACRWNRKKKKKKMKGELGLSLALWLPLFLFSPFSLLFSQRARAHPFPFFPRGSPHMGQTLPGSARRMPPLSPSPPLPLSLAPPLSLSPVTLTRQAGPEAGVQEDCPHLARPFGRGLQGGGKAGGTREWVGGWRKVIGGGRVDGGVR